VSVVLIEARRPMRNPLPVLSRGDVDPVTGREQGLIVEPSLLPPYPTIVRVEPDDEQPAARLGETVRLAGHHLDGTAATARFAHRLLDEPNERPIGAITDSTGADVAIPDDATAEEEWPAGVYAVSLALVRPGETDPQESNVATLLLAPEPVLAPAPAVVRDGPTQHVTVTLEVRPRVRPSQDVRLTLGGESALADPHPDPTSTLTFRFGPVPPGDQWARLTVDGVDSILVNRLTEPPSFDPTQFVTVPA
jgi:hypothetical protein